jgi:hypothetical protein
MCSAGETSDARFSGTPGTGSISWNYWRRLRNGVEDPAKRKGAGLNNQQMALNLVERLLHGRVAELAAP